MKKILILTGEKSGEIIAKPLVLELKNRVKESIHISGMTGDTLSPYLDETIINSSNFGVVGFVEALSKYRVLKKAQSKIFRELKSSNFDLVILVDFIGFNLTIGKFARWEPPLMASIMKCYASICWSFSLQVADSGALTWLV